MFKKFKKLYFWKKNENFSYRLRRFYRFSYSWKIFRKKLKVVGIDNLNNYYDVKLKKDRLKLLKKNKKDFLFIKNDIKNINFLKKIVKK